MRGLPIAILALISPVAALAQFSGTVTLAQNQILSLDSGTVVTSGGDIQWTGNGIAFQGSATGLDATTCTGITGTSGLATLDIAVSLGVLFDECRATNETLPLSELNVNDIFAVETIYGNYAAFLVTAQTGSTITLQFISFAPSAPIITQVLNNYGLVPAGFINSGIAPGMLFIIKGHDLASAPSVSSLESATGGSVLPTTLNGASVKVTVGSVSVTPVFYYAEYRQLALVLPSSTPLGAGTVTVTYNGQTSQPFNVQVVANAFGFAASDQTGTGQAHAQDLDYEYYGYTNSILPGATIRLIGSGLGADPTRDSQYVLPTAASAINALAHVYVGGVDADIYYQGPEGFPGLDEVDVTIPSNAATGCFVSVVGVSTTGVPTNFLTLPVGNGVCEDPALGDSGSAISRMDGQATVNTGAIVLNESIAPSSGGSGTTASDAVTADFPRYTGSAYGMSNSGAVSIGGCIVQENGSAAVPQGLDAGTIKITGPSASVTLTWAENVDSAGEYLTPLAAGFIPASGGTFQVTGSGGTDIGPFTTQIIFPNPALIWTNQSADAIISRSTGVTITWNGGEPGTFVMISGNSSPGGVTASFTCLAPESPTQFSVPGYVTATMPAGSGTLAVANFTNYSSFTATGLDTGYAAGFVNYSITAMYQ